MDERSMQHDCRKHRHSISVVDASSKPGYYVFVPSSPTRLFQSSVVAKDGQTLWQFTVAGPLPKRSAANRHACLVLVYGNSGSIPHKDHGEERDFVLHIVGTTTTTTTTSDTDTGVTNDNTGKTYKSVSQCVMDPMSGQYKVHVTTPIDTIEVKIILRHYHPRCGTNQNVENDNGTVDTQDPSAVAALLEDEVQVLPHMDFFQFGDATMARPSAFQQSGNLQHSTTLSSLSSSQQQQQLDTRQQQQQELGTCENSQAGFNMLGHGYWQDKVVEGTSLLQQSSWSKSSQWFPFCCRMRDTSMMPHGGSTTSHMVGDFTMAGRTTHIGHTYDGSDTVWHDFLLRIGDGSAPQQQQSSSSTTTNGALLLNQGLHFLARLWPHAAADLVIHMTCHAALFFEGKMALLKTIYDPVLLTSQEDGQKTLTKDRDSLEYKRQDNDDDDENILTNHNITYASVLLLNDIVRERFAKAQYKLVGVCASQSDDDLLTLRIAPDEAGLFRAADMENNNNSNGSTESEQNMLHILGNEKVPNRTDILADRTVFLADTTEWIEAGVGDEAAYHRLLHTIMAMRLNGRE